LHVKVKEIYIVKNATVESILEMVEFVWIVEVRV
jgi:hypothetical protein